MKIIKQRLCMILAVVVWCLWCGCHGAMAAQVQAVNAQAELTLEDGTRVIMAGVVFPEWNAEVRQPIERMAKAQPWQLETLWHDRYGHAVVIARDPEGEMLQEKLVKAGLAMAYSPQAFDALPALLASDGKTRWLVDHEQAERYIGGYRTVMGTVQQVAIKRNMAFINFGKDWRYDFTIFIPPENLRRMDHAMLQSLVQQKIVVRGWIERYDGTRITLYEPSMMSLYAPEPNRD